MAGLYGVYHGPEGLTRIADRWVGVGGWVVCVSVLLVGVGGGGEWGTTTGGATIADQDSA